MSITKAQRALREEAKRYLWHLKMADARRAIEMLVLLTPTSETRNRLTEINMQLMQIDKDYNDSKA